MAYALLHLARWLDKTGFDFWDERVRRGGQRLELFRDHLSDLVEGRERRLADKAGRAWLFEAADPSAATQAAHEHNSEMKGSYAQYILKWAFRLCNYWAQQLSEPQLGDRRRGRRRGSLASVKEEFGRRALPYAFVLRKVATTPDGNHFLTSSELDRVWGYWLAKEPALPSTLLMSPRSGWSEEQRKQWEATSALYNRARAWWARNVAILALLSGTGCRVSELGLLTRSDLYVRGGSLYAHFEERMHTLPFGKLKTHVKDPRLDWEARIVRALREWESLRPHLVDQQVVKGIAPHEMYLTRRDGSPFQAPTSAKRWVDLTNSVGPFGAATPGDQWSLTTHVFRHTLKARWASGGVPAEIIARQLGHASVQSTEFYGGVFDVDFNRTVDRFRSSLSIEG